MITTKSIAPLDRSAPTYIAGHKGLVGSALWRKLEQSGFTDLIGRTSAELDLRNRADVFAFFEAAKPSCVVLAAAKVGGIVANNTYPVDFISDNLQIQTNVLDAALRHGVRRLLFLGSSCIYPRLAPQPIREDQLLNGHLEPTNDAYAIAKIAGIIQVQAVRRQFGLPWISAMPTSLYGPGDNFSENVSHVLPAMIRRLDQAKNEGIESVTNWGSGAHVENSSMWTTWPMHSFTYLTPSTSPGMSTSVPVTTKPLKSSQILWPKQWDMKAEWTGTQASPMVHRANYSTCPH